MDYTLEYLQDKGYVRVRIEGTVVLPAARECALKVFHLATQTGCKKILLDSSRATVNTEVPDIHMFLSQMESMGGDRQMSIATIFRKQPDKFRYLETAARNRGFNFRVFPDVPDAEAWLSGVPAGNI